jgi:ATP-dependent DNA helicase RecG
VTKSDQELQAILQGLQQLPKGTEWIEFKEVSQDFDFDHLGKSFSALSNEANLHGEHAVWLVFGVNDKASVVGSQFCPHRAKLDFLKQEVAIRTSHNHTFVEIYELHDAAGRVILFQIPPAPPGMPIAWNGRCYGRDGDSLVALTGSEIEQIRWQQAGEDWSMQAVPNAGLKALDPAAIAQARADFKQRLQNGAAVASVDDWDDTVFLDCAKLTVAESITRTAILLLGRPESAALLSPALAQITWRLDGEEEACAHFGPPFLLTVHDVFRRIGNARFRLQPFGQTIPVELEKYDARVLLEALDNCIAHQHYALRSPVVVTEFSDRLVFEYAGTFFEGTVEDCVLAQKTPQHYRNPFLAHAMVSLNMIDASGCGIQRMFTGQRKRFFPMPDYDLI